MKSLDPTVDHRKVKNKEKKSVNEAVEQVIEMVADCIGRRFRNYQIKDILADMNGGKRVSVNTFNSLMNKARKQIRERLGIAQADGQVDALKFYEDIISDPHEDTRNKIRAQERIDAILGLDAKYQQENDADVLAARLRTTMKQMDQTTDGG